MISYERAMKAMKACDTDDVMAVKSHYFATILRKATAEKDINTWIKKYVCICK